MSMELRLILAHNHGRGFRTDSLYAGDELGLDQDYDLFTKIDYELMGSYGRGVEGVCDPKPIPPGFEVKVLDEEGGWKTETGDPYGAPLTYVLAKELAKIKPGKDWSDWNRAVWAMLKALPPDFPVILWWH